MSWWATVLTVWILGSIPLAVLIGKAIALADARQPAFAECEPVTTERRMTAKAS